MYRNCHKCMLRQRVYLMFRYTTGIIVPIYIQTWTHVPRLVYGLYAVSDAMCCFLPHFQCAHPNTQHCRPPHIRHVGAHAYCIACLALRVLRHTTIQWQQQQFLYRIRFVRCRCWMSVRFLMFFILLLLFCFHYGFGARRSIRRIAFNACVRHARPYVQFTKFSVCVGTSSRADALISW